MRSRDGSRRRFYLSSDDGHRCGLQPPVRAEEGRQHNALGTTCADPGASRLVGSRMYLPLYSAQRQQLVLATNQTATGVSKQPANPLPLPPFALRHNSLADSFSLFPFHLVCSISCGPAPARCVASSPPGRDTETREVEEERKKASKCGGRFSPRATRARPGPGCQVAAVGRPAHRAAQ